MWCKNPRTVRAGLLVAAGVLVGLAGVAWWFAPARGHPPPDPRLSYETPFDNVRPGVKYVGDAACAACHRDIAATYRHHPMGRSADPVAQVADQERFDASAHNPFTQLGTEYEVKRDGDRVTHRASRKAADGRALFEIDAEVAFVIGSGTRGRSYLVEHDGRLFQSPISWFAQKQIWDLSPGFGPDRLFDRPIPAECVFCHANDARPVPGTLNQFERPIFRQHAIGCERCHGPGELHVALRERGDKPPDLDPTIVDPGRLAPALREAVCEQCHLQGQTQVLRNGREVFDYRPGMPVDLFWSVFVRVPKLAEEYKAVGHVEQMHVSRCFQASDGKLGCVSCHDPHVRPTEEDRVAFYRGRCLSCHGAASCKVPVAERKKSQPDDSCIGCHMPRRSSSDIVHTAITDHRVPRKAGAGRERSEPPLLSPDESPLVAFHDDRFAPDDPEKPRSLGLALTKLIRDQPQAAPFLARQAQPLLEEAVKRGPGDAAAREGLAFNLWTQGESEKALAGYEKVLAEHPRRELALYEAAFLANQAGRPATALRHARRLCEVNPWSAGNQQQLAQALATGQLWREAADACRAALRLNPARVETRRLLIRCLLRLGDRAAAEAELETLVGLEPAHGGDLRRWFAEQAR